MKNAIHTACVAKDDVVKAMTFILAKLRYRQKPPTVTIQGVGKNLVFSSKSFDAPVPFKGRWGVQIEMAATPFQLLVSKQPDDELMFSYTDGLFTIGRTRITVTEIG